MHEEELHFKKSSFTRVTIKIMHPTGIYLFFFEKLQMPHPGTTPKLYFPVINKLKTTYL